MARSIAMSRHRPQAGACREPASFQPRTWLDDWVAVVASRHDGAKEEIDRPREPVAARRDQQVRQRDESLRALAATFYPGLQCTAQARTIHRLTTHYAALGWQRDRGLAAPPPHYADSPHEFLWRAFAAGAPLPVSERRLRGILRPPPVRPQARTRQRVVPDISTTAASI